MSDLLYDILRIQRAEAPLVQPRLPALFETGNESEAALESNVSVESEPPRPTPTRPSPPPTRPAPEPYRGKLTPDAPPPHNANVVLPTNQAMTEQQSALPARTAPSEADAPNVARAVPVTEPNATRAVEPSSAHAEAAALPTVNPLLPAPPPPLVRPLTELDRIAAQVTQPAPPPTIHVHIGRITVRAVQAAQPKPKPAPAPAEKLSLDEYLKSRARGSQ